MENYQFSFIFFWEIICIIYIIKDIKNNSEVFFMIKIECFIPEDYVSQLRDALNGIGALTVDGCYDYCMAISKVEGSWRALEGASPYMGEIGEICEAEEMKVEFTCKKELCRVAVDIIKKVHPYEKPVINVIHLLNEY